MSTNNLERKVDALIELALATDDNVRRRALYELELLVRQRKGVEEDKPKSVQEHVEEILNEIGVPCNLLGYDYIITATCMVVEDPTIRKYFVSRVYPSVGEAYGTKATRVERAIRTAILCAIDKGNAVAIRNYFGSIMSHSGTVTNSAFICRLAREVEHKIQLTKRGELNEVD